MVFLIESLVICLVFTLIVTLSLTKNPLAWIDDYPPAIIKRARELKLVEDKEPVSLKNLLIKKIPRLIFSGLILGLAAYFFNGSRSFGSGFLVSYGLWLAVAWWDALIIDCLIFCHSKKVIIPGTEDMVKDYHDYMFHIKMSAVGSLLGIPGALVSGILTALLGLI